MLFNRRIETIVLMVCGALLAWGSYRFAWRESYTSDPASDWAVFCGIGLLAGAFMMCTGAVLDYLHQRNRPM